MAKYGIWMKREKAADMLGYAPPAQLVSVNYDPTLYSKLLCSSFGFKTVEEAEAAAKKIARDLFIYDHTKRARVQTDFRLYRWWILDLEKKLVHNDGNEFTVAALLSYITRPTLVNGFKNVIAKKGKADFSKEADPSKGAIKARAEAEAAKTKAKYEEWWSSPKALLDNFAPKDSKVLDLLPSGTQWIRGFGKDSLKLPEKFCFVFPTHPFKFGEHIANQLGIDYTHPRKTIWAVASYELKWFEKQWSNGEPNNYEMYGSSWKIFSSLEEAMIYAKLGTRQPQVLENPYDAPNYIQYLLGNCCGNGNILFPYKIYRLMVADGKLQPVEKYVKKDAE